MHGAFTEYWVLTQIIFQYTYEDVWSREKLWPQHDWILPMISLPDQPLYSQVKKNILSLVLETPEMFVCATLLRWRQQESLAKPKCLRELYKANQTVWKENSALLYRQIQREDYCVWLTEQTSQRQGSIRNDFSVWLEGTGRLWLGQDSPQLLTANGQYLDQDHRQWWETFHLQNKGSDKGICAGLRSETLKQKTFRLRIEKIPPLLWTISETRRMSQDPGSVLRIVAFKQENQVLPAPWEGKPVTNYT